MTRMDGSTNTGRGSARDSLRVHVGNAVGPVVRGMVARARDPELVQVRIRFEDQDVIVAADEPREGSLWNRDRSLHVRGFSLNVGRRLELPAAVSVIEPTPGAPTEREVTPDLWSARELPPSAAALPYLFYVHIPKTGGTSLNDALRCVYGDGASAIHVESAPTAASISGRRFLSGHLPYGRYLALYAGSAVLSAATLREPLRQLISHLLWVRRLAEPQERATFAKRPRDIQQIALRLARVDFTSAESLAELVSGLEGSSLSLFDNCQTRYLTRRTVGGRNAVTEADLDSAIRALDELDCVGLTERLDDFWARLTRKIGLAGTPPPLTRENVRRYDYPVAREDPAVREALLPLMRHDLRLYEEAVARADAPA